MVELVDLSNPFVQARVKIDRARRHLLELEMAIAQTAPSHVGELIVKEDLDAGGYYVCLAARRFPPTTFALAIGDAVHNLMASLDYIMVGLVKIAKPGMSTNRVHFPVDKTRDALKKSFEADPDTGKRGRNRYIAELFPDLVEIILNEVKPYEGDDLSVWHINALDRLDKHNLITPAVMLVGLSGVRIKDTRHQIDLTLTLTVGADSTSPRIGFPPRAELEIEDEGQPTFSVCFAEEAEVLTGDPVVPTLKQMAELASGVVDTFEAHFKGG